MKQIVDKLNKIAKAIDENVELSDRDLIIDSLDSITKAFGGTPNNSNLIVDKLEDIAGVASGGGGGSTGDLKFVIPRQRCVLSRVLEEPNLINVRSDIADYYNIILEIYYTNNNEEYTDYYVLSYEGGAITAFVNVDDPSDTISIFIDSDNTAGMYVKNNNVPIEGTIDVSAVGIVKESHSGGGSDV